MTEIPTKSVLVNYKDERDLIYDPVMTRRMGNWADLLPGQCADGYGKKITTHWKIDWEGVKRRIYCTQISNAGSWWFMVGRKKVFVS